MSEVAVHQMTERDATQLTEKIRITAHNYADARQKLQTYVAEAKTGNAHLALGYASWTAYLAEVLGEEPMRLARGERQEMVQMLSAEGMSTRAIAPIVGVSQDTVVKDINRGERNLSPAQPITDTLGPVTKLTGPNSAADVIGMDGKTYHRTEQEKEVVTITMERPKLSGPRKKDSNILANINLGLNGYVAALDQMIRTGLDDSVTAEEAGALHADLSRSIKELNTIARMLKNRKES